MAPKRDRIKTIELAEKYVQAGKIKAAIAEYQKLLVGGVQDINIRNIIGDLHVRSNEKIKAQEEFKKIADYYEKNRLYAQAIAIYKKINKLNPENTKIALKLADLFATYGFISEAKAWYLNVAENLKKEGRLEEAIPLYEKLKKLDKENSEVRMTLAVLYEKEGKMDQAVDEFNTIAESMLRAGQLDEAEKVLKQARRLKESHVRTISNIINLLKMKSKIKEAVSILNKALQEDKGNLRLKNLLGSLYFENKDFDKAKKIYAEVLSTREMDQEARIKTGRIFIQEGNLDKAFELFEPIVDTLIEKENLEKAIGLLGLILSSKKVHLPSLEKLALIYKSTSESDNLEIVYRVILEEYREKGLKEELLSILRELVKLSPKDNDLADEYRQLKQELGIKEEEVEIGPSQVVDDEKDILEVKLAKADLYLEQGLIRNAKRILQDLKMRYSDEPMIDQKIALLDVMRTKVEEDEIPERIEKVKALESIIEKREVEREHEKEEKVTAFDIFAETDIVPFRSQELGEKKYYNLMDTIESEIKIINSIVNHQIKGDRETLEKELSEIVTEFKNELKDKVDKENYEIHYNLGIAFMEQGLFDDAVEELKLAAKENRLLVDCCSAISLCFRKKDNFKNGLKWIEKGLEAAEKGSNHYYALKYEMASLYEELEEPEKALKLYSEIKEWNDDFRDVGRKIKNLKEITSV
ncbi:MAG: tetratricopeptide repeat protein [Candidatus Aminicenantaceae bacterium]